MFVPNIISVISERRFCGIGVEIGACPRCDVGTVIATLTVALLRWSSPESPVGHRRATANVFAVLMVHISAPLAVVP